MDFSICRFLAPIIGALDFFNQFINGTFFGGEYFGRYLKGTGKACC